MCGIVGFLGGVSHGSDSLAAVANRMADTLFLRGPNDSGVWVDSIHGVALGHRRLSILDISDAGHQPMCSVSGRFVIVFNGEIYNHLSLRQSLSIDVGSQCWKGHSDTETLLFGFEIWGIRGTVERCKGMFAFAVWDNETKSLTLARDRVGEKPLYYGWKRGCNNFLFGSELKALAVHPKFKCEIDRSSLSTFMNYGYIPSPHSIYKDVYKLPPGCLLTVSERCPIPTVSSYWSFNRVLNSNKLCAFQGTDSDAVQTLDSILLSAVSSQMISDVPIGAFLSGGIDSSIVVALMQSQSSQPIKTFTIGFNDSAFNEAEDARKVASHLGTDHTDLYVTDSETLDVVPRLSKIYSEPFADPSQIPTFLVAQLAKRQVTVSLSGDAGDELFGGYTRYLNLERLWRLLSRFPRPFRAVITNAITLVPIDLWNAAFVPLKSFSSKFPTNIGDKAYKFAEILRNSDDFESLYRGALSASNFPESVVLNSEKISYSGSDANTFPHDLFERMMLIDSQTYLPDDILVKVDRASMAVSLENRVPFLDTDVINFAWHLPMNMKIRDGQGKWILRQVLSRYVPSSLFERPKKGFGVPLGDWLRGPLKEWAEELLDVSRLNSEGFFVTSIIRKKWEEHLSGNRNWQNQLWKILMFQSWLQEVHHNNSTERSPLFR